MDAAGTQTDVAVRPIGFWLKHLDNLIEQSFGRCLAEDGLSRRHWQTMNVLKQGAVADQDLTEAMRPFLREGAVLLGEVTEELVRRGWISRDTAGRFVFTAEGEAAYSAVAKRVHASRLRTMDGLTQAEYQETVRVLQRMADNLAA